jgi:hypothetical protein
VVADFASTHAVSLGRIFTMCVKKIGEKIGIVLKKCRFNKIAKILPNFSNHQIEI